MTPAKPPLVLVILTLFLMISVITTADNNNQNNNNSTLGNNKSLGDDDDIVGPPNDEDNVGKTTFPPLAMFGDAKAPSSVIIVDDQPTQKTTSISAGDTDIDKITFPPMPPGFEDPKGVIVDPAQPSDKVTQDPDLLKTAAPSTIDDGDWLLGPLNKNQQQQQQKNNSKILINNDDDDITPAPASTDDDVIVATTTDRIDAEMKQILDEMDRKIGTFKSQAQAQPGQAQGQPQPQPADQEDQLPFGPAFQGQPQQQQQQTFGRPPQAQPQMPSATPPPSPSLGQGQEQGQAQGQDQWIPPPPPFVAQDTSRFNVDNNNNNNNNRPMIQPPDFIISDNNNNNPFVDQSGRAGPQALVNLKSSESQVPQDSMAAIQPKIQQGDVDHDYLDLLNNLSKILISASDKDSASGSITEVTSDSETATAVPLVMKQDMDPFGNLFKTFSSNNDNMRSASRDQGPRPPMIAPQDKPLDKIWIITDNGDEVRPMQLSIVDNNNMNSKNGEDMPNSNSPGQQQIQQEPLPALPPLPDFNVAKDSSSATTTMKSIGGKDNDEDQRSAGAVKNSREQQQQHQQRNRQHQQPQENDDDLLKLFSILFPDSDKQQKKNNAPASVPLLGSDHSDDRHDPDQSADDTLSLTSDGTPSSVSYIFCKAKCMQLCMDTDGNSMADCDLVCQDVTSDDLCAPNDKVCLKSCGPSPTTDSFNVPNVTDVKYFTMGDLLDPETVEVTWDPLPGATLYIIDFIPNSRSVESGSFVVKEDITNVPWYSLKKGDLCYEYYVRVAAVYKDGITPYSQPKFLKSAFTTHPMNLKVEVGEISAPEVLDFDPNTGRPMTITYAQVDMAVNSRQHMDLSKLELTSYVLASDCRNLPSSSMTSSMTSSSSANDDVADDVIGELVSPGKYKIDSAQFLYVDQAVSMRIPAQHASYDCKYEYRIASIKTRCDDVISFTSSSSDSYDSTTGVDFRLNCANVPYKNCKISLNTTPSNTPFDTTDDSDKQQMTSSSAMTSSSSSSQPGPNCDMTGFSADVIGNLVDKFNVTISWQSINDQLPKNYVVKHGRAHRRLIVPSEFEMTFEPEDTITIFDDGQSEVEQKSVKLSRPFGHDELHVFQICAVYDLSSSESDRSDLLWDLVPKHVLDMAAFPTPSFGGDTVPSVKIIPDPPMFSKDAGGDAGDIVVDATTTSAAGTSQPSQDIDDANDDDLQQKYRQEWAKSQQRVVDPPPPPPASKTGGDDSSWLTAEEKITLRKKLIDYESSSYFGRNLEISWFLLATVVFSFVCFFVVISLLMIRYKGGCGGSSSSSSKKDSSSSSNNNDIPNPDKRMMKFFNKPQMPQFLVKRSSSMKKPIMEDVDFEKDAAVTPVHSSSAGVHHQNPASDQSTPEKPKGDQPSQA